MVLLAVASLALSRGFTGALVEGPNQALIVGCSSYAARALRAGPGIEGDVQSLTHTLRDRTFKVNLLVGKAATSSAIMSGVRRLAASHANTLYLHFAGIARASHHSYELISYDGIIVDLRKVITNLSASNPSSTIVVSVDPRTRTWQNVFDHLGSVPSNVFVLEPRMSQVGSGDHSFTRLLNRAIASSGPGARLLASIGRDGSVDIYGMTPELPEPPVPREPPPPPPPPPSAPRRHFPGRTDLIAVEQGQVWAVPQDGDSPFNDRSIYRFYTSTAANGLTELGNARPKGSNGSDLIFEPLTGSGGEVYAKAMTTFTSVPGPVVFTGDIQDSPFGQELIARLKSEGLVLESENRARCSLFFDFPRQKGGAISNPDRINLLRIDGTFILGTDRYNEVDTKAILDATKNSEIWNAVETLDPQSQDVSVEAEMVPVDVHMTADHFAVGDSILAPKLNDQIVPVGQSFVIRLKVKSPNPTVHFEVKDLASDMTSNRIAPQERDATVAADDAWHFVGPASAVDALDQATVFRTGPPLGPETIKLLVSTEPLPFEPTLETRGSDSNPNFTFERQGDGGLTVIQRHEHWATADIRIRVVEGFQPDDAPSEIRYLGLSVDRTIDKVHLESAVNVSRVSATLDHLGAHVSRTLTTNPTALEFKTRVREICQSTQPNDLLLIHLAGSVTKEGFVNFDNERVAHPISLWVAGKALGASYARHQILLLDTVNGDPDQESLRSLISASNNDNPNAATSTFVIASGNRSTDARQTQDLSLAWTEAIESSQTDLNSDGLISASEMGAAIERAQKSGGTSSTMLQFRLGPDFVIGRSPAAKPSTLLASTLPTVRDEFQGGSSRGTEPATAVPAPNDIEGRDFAILVGVDSYHSMPDLKGSPSRDVQRLTDILRSKYHFQVIIPSEPNAASIVEAIRAFRDRKQFSIGPNDQLLFFFAGHSNYVEEDKDGYLYFKDSEPYDALRAPSSAGLLPFSTLAKELDSTKFGHVLMVLDSCYGGKIYEVLNRSAALVPNGSLFTMTMQGSGISDANRAMFAKMLTKRSRIALCSGDGPVPNGNEGQGSPFATALAATLELYANRPGFCYLDQILPPLRLLPSSAIEAPFPFCDINGGFVLVGGGRKPASP